MITKLCLWMFVGFVLMPRNGAIVEFLRWFRVKSRELMRAESHLDLAG
jgi:hypothetical protein